MTLSARQSSRQLAIWGSNGWEQPEQDFQSSRQRTQLRSAYSLNGRTYVFGQFGQASDPLQSAVAIFGDEGISNVTMVPELSSSAVMDESGKAYAWTPDGLWVNPGEEPVVLNVPGASAGAALALTDALELFIGTCGQQLLRLQGGILPVAAELPDDLEILCDVPLVVIHESSPATGIYYMAAQPKFVFVNGRRVSVWRFDGVELSEVSPAELTGFVASQTYPPQVSPITIGGEVFPALAFGSRLTWFDGQQWTSFPLIPGELLSNGDVSGPVASAKIGNDECVFATLRTQIIQFCNNQWSTSDTLAFSFMNTIDLIFQRGIQTLFASDYQERPVLLVGGSFDGAGDSTQSRSAVLDLDVIYRNGLEV